LACCGLGRYFAPIGFEFGSLNGDVVTSDEVRTWLYETDWRRASVGAPGCVAAREWREFEDAVNVADVVDVVDITDDAESLPLTLVCGVGKVDEARNTGESDGGVDIMKAGGNTGNMSCTVVTGRVSRIIRERDDRVDRGREQKTPDQTPTANAPHADPCYAK
jgi:hypothetical protein